MNLKNQREHHETATPFVAYVNTDFNAIKRRLALHIQPAPQKQPSQKLNSSSSPILVQQQPLPVLIQQQQRPYLSILAALWKVFHFIVLDTFKDAFLCEMPEKLKTRHPSVQKDQSLQPTFSQTSAGTGLAASPDPSYQQEYGAAGSGFTHANHKQKEHHYCM